MSQQSRAPREAVHDDGASQRPKRPAGPVAVAIVESVPRAASNEAPPWWYAAPVIFERAFHVVFMPFKFMVWASEVVVSLTFAAMVAVVGLWWFNFIPDSDVWIFIQNFAGRIQGILKGAGLM